MPNMTLIKRIELLANAIGVDVKLLNGTIGLLTNLDRDFGTNSANGDLVSAINHSLKVAKSAVAANSDLIDDSTTTTDKTWSSNKINETISEQVAAIVDSAPDAFDTLKEVADWINGNADAVTAISNKVPFNETKTLNDTQKQNVWTTIGIGNYNDSDFVSKYNTAKS